MIGPAEQNTEFLILIKPQILSHIKIACGNCMAQIPAQKKKAAHTKATLERYGSCFLQLLDDEPAPVNSHLHKIKRDFHKQLSRKINF